MIWESSWKLSKLRVVDLGYVPELKPVLLTNGKIAKLQDYTSGGGRFSWLVFNTDSFAWEKSNCIDISEVVGVVVPSSINSIEEYEDQIIKDCDEAQTKGGGPYLIIAKSPEKLEVINRIKEEAKRISKEQ